MFHVKHEAWARDAAAVGLTLTPDQLEQLAGYVGLLSRIAIPRGMIAPSDADRLWERHVLDGLRGAPELRSPATVADIGSGAGLPGLPLAIALPTARFTLLEPRRARVSFLEAVVDKLHLSNVVVAGARAEDISDQFQACVARAFSSPISTWEAAEPLLAPRGVLVYWAGERFERALLDDLGVPTRLSTHSDLARSGPLVIMGPQ
jgi:16S rRNA (guanine527-N7)-methyltransferase